LHPSVTYLAKQPHQFADAETLFPLAIVERCIYGQLFRSLQSVDGFVDGTFDDQSCHVRFFLLADSEHSAECLLLNLQFIKLA